ncbi:MAG: hypothetical protein AAF757_24685 [Cyanobacteria bacterium P01_D01_bin.116]
MKNALSEIKRLGKTKAKKPKELDLKEFLSMVIAFSYSVILEKTNFKQFCEMVEVSTEVREKLQAFARTRSFASYISNPIFTITLNPEYKMNMPTREQASEYSQRYGLIILKNLVEELQTQSVESIASEADEILDNFEQIADDMKAGKFGNLLEEMGMQE